MFNDKTGKLLLEEVSFSSLKPYNYELVEDIKRQIQKANDLINEIRESVTGEISEEIGLNFVFLKFYSDRSVRILMAYHFNRLMKITSINDNLSEDEKAMVSEINIIEDEYRKEFKELDMKRYTPPLHLFVYILCKVNCGVIYEEDECFELIKGRIYYVKKKSIEHLIIDQSVEFIFHDDDIKGI